MGAGGKQIGITRRERIQGGVQITARNRVVLSAALTPIPIPILSDGTGMQGAKVLAQFLWAL